MQLYVGTSSQFIQDSIQNQIGESLSSAFQTFYGRRPSRPEVSSWVNSLRAMAQVLTYSDLDDNGILLEYHLPMTSRRIDCVVTGHDGDGLDEAVIVELKQWEQCSPAEGDRVVTWIGGGEREILHPAVQSDQYRQYLVDSHTAFYGDKAVRLVACSYLHNYSFRPDDPLKDPKFVAVLARTPLFSKDDVNPLRDFLVDHVGEGDGNTVLARITGSTYRPSKKLLDHVGDMIKGNPTYVLLDDQLLAYDKVLTILRRGVHRAEKHVVIVKGGPGTGKSAIAINLMADLLLQGYTAHYATGSKAFTTTLRDIIGSRGGQLFRYFNSYARADPGMVDVLVMDEAHRIRSTSVSRFTPRADRTGTPQIQELLRAAKLPVFFVDDDQSVRPNETGSSAYIRSESEKLGAVVHEFELAIQFRCSGSDAFVKWVENTLGIRPTANPIWRPGGSFDFRVFDSPDDLEAAIQAHDRAGQSARLVAGFCWPWSLPRPD
ncbi:MAG TPA: DNA/RNA helicase domain-containing protein, partial [Thermoplasmata archaeon]|nr:DNA/RNA helicase domain-containing protein [Thermoplasmata archaeon]